MATPAYSEFEWKTTGPGNRESGDGLTKTFISLVTNLRNIRRICDLGCGNGYFVGRLSALGYEVTGVDASESGVAIAQKSYPSSKFDCALIDSRVRESVGRNFDLVVSSDVIEHLYRPADLLEATVSLLKPGGQIIIGTPYHGYLKNLVLGLRAPLNSLNQCFCKSHCCIR